MASSRTKPNSNSESFHQRYSELSDEIRAKNKREDRLLDVRLKYYEREKNIRLNILRKEQYQLERTRSLLIEQLNQIQQDKQKQTIPSYIPERIPLEPEIIQLSTPELFNTNWALVPTETKPPSKKIIRPHSAG